jgi:hypothetical protein
MTDSSVQTSASAAAIAAVTRRSAETKDIIRIIELSTMGALMPQGQAESIRARMLANKVQVRQLTNTREFGPWTGVSGFIDSCMSVRYVDAATLPIGVELVVFDNVVALYRMRPRPWVVVIEDAAVAAQHKALFDTVWNRAEELALQADGSSVRR